LTSTTIDEQQLLQQNQNVFVENAQRSQNEQILYNAWYQSGNARRNLEAQVNSLQSQILTLKVQLNNLSSIKEDKPVAFTQETEEDELASETEWIRVKQNQKRESHHPPAGC
jgi:hypothetical protein